MKELGYLNKYFVHYKYRFLFGILITIVAQIFSLFTPKLISTSFEIIENYFESLDPELDRETIEGIITKLQALLDERE